MARGQKSGTVATEVELEEERNDTHFVYLLREVPENATTHGKLDVGFYKVGKGKGRIRDRIAALQTGNPRRIVTVRPRPS
jgi:hypothetical protein